VLKTIEFSQGRLTAGAHQGGMKNGERTARILVRRRRRPKTILCPYRSDGSTTRSVVLCRWRSKKRRFTKNRCPSRYPYVPTLVASPLRHRVPHRAHRRLHGVERSGRSEPSGLHGVVLESRDRFPGSLYGGTVDDRPNLRRSQAVEGHHRLDALAGVVGGLRGTGHILLSFKRAARSE
jgi:hypothetical protein